MSFPKPLLFAMLLAFTAAPLHALDTDYLSATGGAVVTLNENTNITIPNTATNNRSGMVANGAGSVVQAQDGVVVTITIQDGYNTNYDIRGITASNNGNVVLGETHISVSGYGVYAANPGSTVTLGDNSTVISTRQRALFAQFTNITVGDNVTLSTRGADALGVTGAHAVYSYEDYSSVDIGAGARIITDSAGSHGALATKGGQIRVGDGAVIELLYDNATQTATSGAGLFSNGIPTVNPGVDPASNITVGNNLTISTLAGYGYGMVANEGGTIDTGDNVTITTAGDRATGMYTYSDGSYIRAGDVHITTGGELARGMVSYLNGVLEAGAGSTVETSGFNAAAVYASANATLAVGDASTFTTHGGNSHAVYAYNNSTITLGGDSEIGTSGANSSGMVATTAGASIVAGDGLVIRTTGTDSRGVNALATGRIEIGDNADLQTTGDGAFGLLAQNAGASISVGNDLLLTTSGDRSYGIYAYNGGAVSVGDSAGITTAGDMAHAVLALGADSTVMVGDGGNIATTGRQAHAVFADAGGSVVLTGDQYIDVDSGKDSYALFAMGEDAATLSTIEADGRLTVHGGMVAMYYGDIDVAMRSGSYFEGFTSVETINDSTLNLSMTGSTWVVTESFINGSEGYVIPTYGETADERTVDYSSQGDFQDADDPSTTYEDEVDPTVDASTELVTGGINQVQTVVTDNPVEAGISHSSLTSFTINDSAVDFTRTGLGSTLTTGTLTGNGGRFILKTDIAALQADRLIVTGASSGTHELSIRDQGSRATTGREVVTVVDTADGGAVFSLDATVDAGGFEYDLRRSPGDATNWELYSTGRASRPASASLNGFIGAYLLSNAETTALMRRLGDLRQDAGCTGLWVRGHGGKYTSNHDRLLNGFDMKYGGFQIGVDRRAGLGGGADLFYGAMFGYSDSRLNHPTGKSRTDAKTAGLYGTFLAGSGFYADAMVKYMWMQNDFDVLDNSAAVVNGRKIDSGGVGASLEIGNRFQLSPSASGWYLEPQGQISYTRQNGDSFTATNGLAVQVSSFESFQGRLGLAAGYEFAKGNRPHNLYVKGSVVKEFRGDIRARFNGAPASTSFGTTWWEYGVGYAAQVGPRQHVYAEVEQSRGGRFRRPWAVNVGFRTSF